MEGRGGGAEAQLERMQELQKASEYCKDLKNYLGSLKKEIENAVRDGDFTRAADLKRKKDAAEKARAPLLHFVTRFTQNKMKAANPVDRFKGGGPPPKAEGEEEEGEGGGEE